MSDFHTWNELQEDTTGRSADTNSATSHEAWQAWFRAQWLESTSHALPGSASPGQDRRPGLLRLYVCTLVGGTQRIAASEKFEHAGMPCSGYRQQPTVQRGGLVSFQGPWRVEMMLSLAHPFVLQTKTVRQRQRERQHLTVVATLGPKCLLYTLRVWMRGATGPRRCRTSVFVSPACCKVAIVANHRLQTCCTLHFFPDGA